MSSLSDVIVVAAASVDGAAAAAADGEAAVADDKPCNIPSKHAALRQWTNDAAEKQSK